MPDTILNVPNLRFPGFSGEWERMKASDLLEFFSTNSLSWEQLEFGGTGLLNLHYGLIHNGLPSQIDINNSSLPAIKAGNEPRRITLCKEGDIAVADASEDTNDVGKVVEFVDCAGKNVVCGLHTIHGRDKLDITVLGFKVYAFSSKAFHDQIKRIAQGTKVFSISVGCFDEVCVGIPSKEEQKRIAGLLSLIDQRIAIQNKVIEKYESLIRAIYHEAFSNASGTMINLGNLVQIKKGAQLNGENLLTIGRYYVMNGGITPSGFYDSYNTHGEVISISEGGNSCGYVQYNASPFWSGGHCYSLLPKSQYKDVAKYKYLYHYLKYHQNDIMAMRIGSGLPNIQKKDLERFQIILPEPQKQERYTTLFDAVDRILALEKDLLNKLLEKKTYLISQMFI